MQSKKYYRSIKRRIEEDNIRREQGQQAVKKRLPKKTRIDLTEIYIPTLPKRLKRGFWRGLDYRYLVILLASLIFHLALIFVLYQNTSFELSQEKIQNIHSSYAKLILEQEALNEATLAKMRPTGPSLRQEERESTEEKREQPNRRSQRSAPSTEETRIPDTQQFEEERQMSQAARRSRRNAVSTQVGSMGLLEYIKGTVITSKVDDDFLNYTDAANRNFIRMLDGMDAEDLALLKLNRATAGPFGFPDGGDTLRAKSKIKTTKRSTRKATAQELFGSDEALEEIESLPVEKNKKFVENTNEPDALSKLRKRVVKRIPAELSKTIQRHTRAIQDCYKTVLRKEVALNGKVSVRISIDAAGRVVDAVIVSSTVNNDQMERCLASRIRRWRDFGNCPTQQGIFTFTQTFSFGM